MGLGTGHVTIMAVEKMYTELSVGNRDKETIGKPLA